MTGEELAVQEWIDLVSATHRAAQGERVVIAVKLLKGNVLRIKKPWMSKLPGFAGLGLKRGREVQMVSAGGGNKVVLPSWVMDQLGLGPRDTVCITERSAKFCLKRLEVVERPSRIPTRLIVDSFRKDRVCRTYTRIVDLGGVTYKQAGAILSKMGRLRRDPLKPFEQVDGRIGWLARREFLGGLTGTDKKEIQDYKRKIVDDQGPDGSWAGSTIQTAFNVIRLAEVGVTRRSTVLRKATEWLLATPGPDRLPGVFMFSPELTREFNAWRAAGNIGRFTPGGKQKRYKDSEQKEFRHGADVGYWAGCEPRFIWPTAVCVEALLRAGLHANPRVGKAINTALVGSAWDGWRAQNFGKPWCGCAGKVLGGELVVEDVPAEADFNAPVANPDLLECLNHEGLVEPWEYATARCGQCAEVDGRALWLMEGTGFCGTGGPCTDIMHRAMSWHPKYAGSNLETTAILNFRSTHRAYSLAALEWLSRRPRPLSAFFVLRSVPHLIRCQEDDGLWPTSPWAREETSLIILRALKAVGFLNALLPE